MKKQFQFLLSFVLLLVVSTAFGQQKTTKLPVDPAVRIGTLPNGLKYYIYKNETPKGLADFYIIHNVGAIEEDDHQNGLAHFLEHMAFNGTKSLPGKKMLDYFQANGVEFGRDINAQTGMDETQYMITNVPISREGILDTAIMAITDWAGGVTLKDSEIDNERGVILEEKRTGENAGRRMQEQFLKVLYNGSKYADRNVIGTEEILKNFKYSDLRDFYKKWYRPDLQAIIIAGDIDIDAVEAKLKKVAGAIPAHSNPTAKETFLINKFEKDITCIVTDKEATTSSAMIISIADKRAKEDNDTQEALFNDLIGNIISSAINERYTLISRDMDAPFLSANFGLDALTPFNDIIACDVSAREGQLPQAIEAAMKEVTRMYQFGVTEDEVERFKINSLKGIKTNYDNRADRETGEIVNLLISNYTNNTPILTPDAEYEVYTDVLNKITAQVVNKMIPQIYQTSPVVIITTTSDKAAAIPTEESLLAAYNNGKTATVDAPRDEKIDRPLVEKQPTAVKIVKESKDVLGNTVWKLKNGATIVIKPTEFRADEISFTAVRDGGTNMVSADKLMSVSYLSNMTRVSGLGTFNSTELRKVLTGKTASVSKSISSYTHGIDGDCVKADMKTMFELLYLSYTAQPFLESDYDRMMKRVSISVEDIESQPDYIYKSKTNKILYGDDPRTKQTNKETIKEINLADIKAIHDNIFDGVDGMTFVFVGSIDLVKLKPLVEQYIGSLPKGVKKNQDPTSSKLVKGKVSETIPIKLETPKVSYSATFYTDAIKDYSIKNQTIASMLSNILNIKYTKSIREEMGATYGVRAGVFATDKPTVRYTIDVSFDTSEDKVGMAAPQVKKEIEAIANGASVNEELNMSRGAIVKNFEKSINSSNNIWVNYIQTFYQYGINTPKDYIKTVNSITEKDIQEFARKILESGNEIELIMVPAK